MKIIIGLIFISIIVVLHEFGHLLMAKLCGVAVESFSVGWGPILLKKKIGQTEYRLSAVPLGGYCGMRGEQAFKEALENNLPEIPYEEGGLYSVSPFRRILIAVAGPLANLLTAIVVFAIVSTLGMSYETFENKIIPEYLFSEKEELPMPSKIAGLQAGDRIIKIDDTDINNYRELQKTLMIHPNESLNFVIERNGETIMQTIKLHLNKKTGAGYLGVYPFIALHIASITPASVADKAGLAQEDIIIAVNNTSVTNTIELSHILDNRTTEYMTLTISRNGKTFEKTLPVIRTENMGVDLGIHWKTQKIVKKGTGLFTSIRTGFSQSGETIMLTLKSLGLLFSGIDLKESVSGPLRISHMLGEAASIAVTENLKTGIIAVLDFIAIISISLFILNLLPIPVFDGGLIFVTLVQIVIRRPLKPKSLYRIQFIGFIFIVLLFMFALWSDIRFFITH